MPQTKEAGRRVAPRTGFQNVFVGTIDRLEHSHSLPEGQAATITVSASSSWTLRTRAEEVRAAVLAARKGLGIHHARVVIDLLAGPGRRS